jgi:DNA polymerase III delta prime subunit
MLCDKYKPIFLDDYKIHLNLIPKLKFLCKTDITNILVYGPKGSGKLTLVKSLINTYYNTDIIEINKFVKINNKEVSFKSSKYYFEIILDSYYNKKKFEELLLYLCDSNDINSKFKLIIIKNIEYINDDSFRILKYFIEKKYNNIRFILITSNISNINNFLKGSFLLFRVPYPNKNELFDYISTIYNIKASKLKTIINESTNLTSLFLQLEINILNNYICPYKTYSNKFVKLLESKNINNIIKIRELLYTIMSKNYDLKLICHSILNKFLTKNSDKKKELIELFTNYDNTNKSFKNIIHIESLLINIIKLYSI